MAEIVVDEDEFGEIVHTPMHGTHLKPNDPNTPNTPKSPKSPASSRAKFEPMAVTNLVPAMYELDLDGESQS
jgi:hypothetical protein